MVNYLSNIFPDIPGWEKKKNRKLKQQEKEKTEVAKILYSLEKFVDNKNSCYSSHWILSQGSKLNSCKSLINVYIKVVIQNVLSQLSLPVFLFLVNLVHTYILKLSLLYFLWASVQVTLYLWNAHIIPA